MNDIIHAKGLKTGELPRGIEKWPELAQKNVNAYGETSVTP